MERQSLLVELGRLDRPGRLLDPQPHQHLGRDRPPAHPARLAGDVGLVVRQRPLAGPMAVEGQRDPRAQQVQLAGEVARERR